MVTAGSNGCHCQNPFWERGYSSTSPSKALVPAMGLLDSAQANTICHSMQPGPVATTVLEHNKTMATLH